MTPPPRSWLLVPVLGMVGIACALAMGRAPLDVAAAALVGAGVAAAVRVLAGDSASSLAGAATGGLVACATIASSHDSPWPWLGGAAAAWTIAELARPLPADPKATPAVAMIPAALAAGLDPAYVALVLLAGLRMYRAPQSGTRAIIAPIVGALACIAELVAARWTASPHHVGAQELASRFGEALGPLVAVAALAGLAVALRARAFGALPAIALGALIASFRAGAVLPCALVVTALATGLAVARLAAVVRHPTGQACVGATIGLVVASTIAPWM